MGLMRALVAALFLRGGTERLIDGGLRAARALRPDATRVREPGAYASHSEDDMNARTGWFDAAVNGVNRLPRPMLALGTLGLFVYAMVDPPGFALRMRGLAEVPEPMWWLLGAVVAFYFGAREAHHLREHRAVGGPPSPAAPTNSALAAWRAEVGDTPADPPGRERD